MSLTYQKILQQSQFTPPNNWLAIRTIDMHTGGEPLRVILDGFPNLEGSSVLEYRNFIKNNYDHLRCALMHEPRGHADMYGCILTPPNDESGDFGIIFLHNEGYSTMCGHATIAIAKLAVEMGWVQKQFPETKILIDAPCGRLEAFVKIAKDGKIESIYFHCVPSFVVGLDLEVQVPKLGTIRYDLAYGGAFYAYVQAAQIDLELSPQNYNELIQKGMAIKHAVMNSPQKVEHPFESDLSFLYGTIFIDDSPRESVDSRNVCIFADGEVDRCPTGSGVSGRMAIHYQRNEIDFGETMLIESITGSIFKGSLVEQVNYGSYKAIVPKVEGRAYITGQHTFLIDPNDPFKNGFFLR